MCSSDLARIVDRYALCDIENDTYEYHERLARKLYPERGSYSYLVEAISNRYTLISEEEKKDISELLSLENIYGKINFTYWHNVHLCDSAYFYVCIEEYQA